MIGCVEARYSFCRGVPLWGDSAVAGERYVAGSVIAERVAVARYALR